MQQVLAPPLTLPHSAMCRCGGVAGACVGGCWAGARMLAEGLHV